MGVRHTEHSGGGSMPLFGKRYVLRRTIRNVFTVSIPLYVKRKHFGRRRKQDGESRLKLELGKMTWSAQDSSVNNVLVPSKLAPVVSATTRMSNTLETLLCGTVPISTRCPFVEGTGISSTISLPALWTKSGHLRLGEVFIDWGTSMENVQCRVLGGQHAYVWVSGETCASCVSCLHQDEE